MVSTPNNTNCTGASRLYVVFADSSWTGAGVDAGMAKRQIPVIGHPSTARRPQEVSL